MKDNKKINTLLSQYKAATTDEQKKKIKERMQQFVSSIAIDTETAGTNPRINQLLEIGGVLLDKNGQISYQFSFKLKRDETDKDKYPDWNPYAEKIHGIKEESLIADGKEVIDMDRVLNATDKTEKEQEIAEVFEVLSIVRPNFKAWNVTFDYSFFETFVYDNNMGTMDTYFDYSPMDIKSYAAGLIKQENLNILKTELPNIFTEHSRMLDKNGDVKMTMSSVNMYFGFQGQLNSKGKDISHSAFEDIVKSVINLEGLKLLKEGFSRAQIFKTLSEMDIYSPSFENQIEKFSAEKINKPTIK